MRKLFVVMLVAAMGSLVACGGGSSGSSSDSTGGSAPEITTIDELPAATGPMASTASAQLAKAAGVGKEASIGMNLATTTIDFFSEVGSSLGACETLNVLKSSISSAAMGDQILCYMKGMAGDSGFEQSGVNVYDGQWHIIHFGGEMQEQDQHSPGKVKFRVAKADGVNVSEFEMFMCSLPSPQYSNGNQMEHIKQTIVEHIDPLTQTVDGSTVVMNSKGNFKDYNEMGGFWEGWHAVALDGQLNSAGAYDNKVITMWDTGSGADEMGNPNTHNQYGVLTQTPGAFEYSGFRAGTFTDPLFGVSTYSDQVASVGEMLKDTSTNLLELAMGDGGTRTLIVADVGGIDKGQDDFYDFWNGDTGISMSGAPASEGGNDFLSVIEGVVLIPLETVSISFGAGETWDCTDDVDSIIELFSVSKKGPDEIESECTQYNLGNEWMNCYSNVEYVEPPEGEGPQAGMSCDGESVCGAVAPETQPACQDCFTNNVEDDAGVYACLTALCTGGSPDPETCSQGAEICNPANL